jgi:hypothetical protein
MVVAARRRANTHHRHRLGAAAGVGSGGGVTAGLGRGCTRIPTRSAAGEGSARPEDFRRGSTRRAVGGGPDTAAGRRRGPDNPDGSPRFSVNPSGTDTGDVQVRAGDLDGDGKAETAVGAGAGRGNAIRIDMGSTIAPTGTPGVLREPDVFPGFSGGVFIG